MGENNSYCMREAGKAIKNAGKMEKEAEGQKDDKRDGALCLLSPVPVKREKSCLLKTMGKRI